MEVLTVPAVYDEVSYHRALQDIQQYFDREPVPGTPEAARFDALTTLIEAYEAKAHSIGLPDPIAAIQFAMEQRGLSRKDLEPAIGGRGRVSDVLNRRRGLSIEMIRKLSALLGLPVEVLVQPYEIRRKTA